MKTLLEPSASLHEARAQAWSLSERRLRRIERRLRRRRDSLDASELTTWYAARTVLRDRGVTLPPATAGLP